MGNWARKIIEAVQNSLLDTLLPRLIQFWWLGSFWGRRRNDLSAEIGSSILAVTLVLFAVAWVLGAIANRRPGARKKGRNNGFEAWSEPPSDGLRPPSWLRAVVMVLGRQSPSNPLIGFFYVTLLATAGGLLWILSFRPDISWFDVSESLVSGSTGDALWLASAAVIVMLVLRQWAVQQRGRLVSSQPSGSDWTVLGGAEKPAP